MFLFTRTGGTYERQFMLLGILEPVYRPPFRQEKSFFPEGRGGGVCTKARHFGEILCQIFGFFTRICVLLQTFNF